VLQPDENVRPDMNARVTFLEPAVESKTPKPEEKLLVIPKRSVLEGESGKMVYVISDGTVQAKPITVQKEVGGDVFVSKGLRGNEAIIVGEQLGQLKVGDRVEASGSGGETN
jgi:multidrug efflux pump subunit AcrA (membrane-fusion protein)